MSSEPVHLLSSSSQFDPDEALAGWMAQVKCKNRKFAVVAILGAQSSGKSTLLNRLFSTQFPVMDATKGRYTCTDGIWAAKAPQLDILVMDVEGTDSAERGEAHAEFESKTSLFSLAISNVLIFNIHEKDIGLYNASSYSLLRTVFEQHVKLFFSDAGGSQPVKTLILVVIRNYERETAAESHASDLMTQFNTIWSELHLPLTFTGSALMDFFDFSFVLLPNKKYEEERFHAEVHCALLLYFDSHATVQVAKLQDRFANPARIDYYLNGNYSKDLSSDHFPQFAAGLWSTIDASEDLTKLGFGVRGWMAKYRCAEIHDTILRDTSTLVDSWRRLIDREIVIERFGEKSEEAVASAMERYHADAGAHRGYPVYEEKAHDLRRRVDATLHSLFTAQLQLLHSQALSAFQKKTQDIPSRFFADAADAALTDTVDDFRVKAIASSRINYWQPTNELEMLQLDLEHILGAARGMALKTLYLQGQNKIISVLQAPLESWNSAPLSEHLGNPGIALWPHLRRLVGFALPHVQENLRDRLLGRHTGISSSDGFGSMCGFRASVEEVQNFSDALHDFVVDHVTSQLRQTVSTMLQNSMRNRFEASFLHTPAGSERQWLPGIDIEAFYDDAVDDSLLLLDLLSINRLEDRHSLSSCFVNPKRCTSELQVPPELGVEYIVLQPNECEEQRLFFLSNVADPLRHAAQKMQDAAVAAAVAAGEALRVKEAPISPRGGSAAESAQLGNVLLAKAKQSEGSTRQALLIHASANFACACDLSESAGIYNSWGIALYQQAKLSIVLGVGNSGKQEAIALCRDAGHKFRKSIHIDPGLVEVHYNLGNVLFEIAGLVQDTTEAVELYSKAIEQFENFDGDDGQRTIDVQINCGVCLMKLAGADGQIDRDSNESYKLYDLACRKFEKAAAQDPYRSDALLNWGVALADHAAIVPDSEAGDMYMAACEKFSAALGVDSRLYDALYNWGNTLTQHARKMPQGEAASAVFENAGDKYSLFVQASPGHTQALTNWAICLYWDAQMRVHNKRSHDAVLQAEELLKTAEAKLRQVLTIKPVEVDAIVKLGLVLTARAELRAQIHEADTLFAAAAECYRKASYLSPRQTAAYVNWGLLLHKKAILYTGHEAYLLYRVACSKHRHAVDLGSVDALVNWGNTLLAASKVAGMDVEKRRDLLREAQHRYREAISQDPNDYQVLKCLGQQTSLCIDVVCILPKTHLDLLSLSR